MCKTTNCHTSCSVDRVEHIPCQFVRCLIPLLYQIDQSPSRLPVVINLVRLAASKHRLDFDVLLTVHLSMTLANDQLDAQFLYFIIRLLHSSTYFEQRRARRQEVKLY